MDSTYFSLISLSTIGFGDLAPSTNPPLRFATTIKNESYCLMALLNPLPDEKNDTCKEVYYKVALIYLNLLAIFHNVDKIRGMALKT